MSIGIITSPLAAKVVDFTTLCGKQKTRQQRPLQADEIRDLRESGVETLLILEAGQPLEDEKSGPGFHLTSDLIGIFDVHTDNPGEEGVEFTDMSEPFDRQLRQRIAEALPDKMADEGCAVGVQRTDLLTPAEVRVLKDAGAHVAVQYLHHETRRARELDMLVVGMTVYPDRAADSGMTARSMAETIWNALTPNASAGPASA